MAVDASNSCHSFYITSARKTLVKSLKDRVENFFGGRYENLESHEVFKVLDRLEITGSDHDIKIFDLYISTLENITGSRKLLSTGAYYSIYSNVNVKTRSHLFQEQHWDPEKLYDYFFDAPLSLDFYRERDINYLKHVLDTAKNTNGEKTLAQVLEQANHSWAIQGLQRFPNIQAQYEHYVSGKSASKLFSELQDKYHLWMNEPTLPAIREQRTQHVSRLLESLRISSSSRLDLFLASKYLDAIEALFDRSEPNSLTDAFGSEQLTHPERANSALASGSVVSLNQVIFQNSHDVIMKGLFVKILDKMLTTGQPMPTIDPAYRFQIAYLKAKDSVYSEVEKIYPTESYQTDLHIYARNNTTLTATYDKVMVEWNPITGYPIVTLVWRNQVHENQSKTVKDVHPLNDYIRKYFNFYRTKLKSNKQTYSREEIQKDEDAELDSTLVNSSYFIFTLPGTQTLVSMARLFDATHTKSFIERELENVVFPERKNKEPIYELGRVYATEYADGNSIDLNMARVALHLKNTNATGVIYLNSTEAGKKYYTRRGAKVVYTPNQLGQPIDATPLWVMKYTVEDFIKQFLKADYQTVKTRKKKYA